MKVKFFYFFLELLDKLNYQLLPSVLVVCSSKQELIELQKSNKILGAGMVVTEDDPPHFLERTYF
jgi:hypothetical protein